MWRWALALVRPSRQPRILSIRPQTGVPASDNVGGRWGSNPMGPGLRPVVYNLLSSILVRTRPPAHAPHTRPARRRQNMDALPDDLRRQVAIFQNAKDLARSSRAWARRRRRASRASRSGSTSTRAEESLSRRVDGSGLNCALAAGQVIPSKRVCWPAVFCCFQAKNGGHP